MTAETETSTIERDDSRMQWSDDSATVVRTRPWELPIAWKRRWRASRAASMTEAAGGEAAAVATTSKSNGARATLRSRCRAAVQGIVWAVASPFRIPDKYIWWAVPALAAMRRIVRKHHPSVLFSTSPPHSSHLIALALKAWTGIPVVIDLRDPWSHMTWDAAAKGGLMQSIQNRLERWCYARADRVILNTPELLADVERQVPAAWRDKFAVIPNGYDPQVRERIEALVRAAGPKPDGAPLKLCHAGTVYGRRDIRPLIEAVTVLNRRGRSVVFEQVGMVTNGAEVAACIARNDAERHVQLLGQRPHEEALRRMAAADILVVVRQNTGLQVPAKLYEMMLFGKPILALDDEGAVTRFVRDYQLGVVADPVDPAVIADSVVRAAESTANLPGEGRAAALREFDARRQTEQLAAILESAVRSSRRGRRHDPST